MATYDGGVLLVDGYPFGATQHVKGGLLQFHSLLLGDHVPTGQHGDVFEHFLAAVAKTGSLHGGHPQGTTQPVDHQGGQGFPVDILGNDQQRPSTLGGLLQHRKQVLHGTDLLIMDQNEGILQIGCHFFSIGHKIGRDVSTVKLHPFHHVHVCVGAF